MSEDIRKMIDKVKNFKQFVNEQVEDNIVRLTFNNINDYNKVDGVLYKNGFKTPTSMDKGSGYYKLDDNWLTIEFNKELQNNILPLINDVKYSLEYIKPMGYKIFNQGGYID